MDGKSLENFLRMAGGPASQGLGIGEGLMSMFGSNLPAGVSAREMEEMWKMLDSMAQKDPAEYKRFIDQQMSEMKQEIHKEKEAEDKQRTVVSNPAFSIKAMVAKVIDEKERKAKADR